MYVSHVNSSSDESSVAARYINKIGTNNCNNRQNIDADFSNNQSNDNCRRCPVVIEIDDDEYDEDDGCFFDDDDDSIVEKDSAFGLLNDDKV